jgi:hypothetical protein
VDGFTNGTSLFLYLHEYAAAVQSDIIHRLAEAIRNQYADFDLHIPMQALVCTARK